MDLRSRYIVRHGFVPWGLLAGGIAAVVTVRSAWRDRSAGAGTSAATLVLLGGLCFVVWAAITGWFIGAFLWDTRETRQRTERDRTPRSRNK